MSSPDKTPETTLPGILGASWGVLGVSALLGSAIWRLGQLAWDALTNPAYSLQTYHWFLAACWLVFMIYSEGVRGFQKKFSPRVAARARYLASHPRALHILLAPLFCMGFFHATRRRMIVSYCLITAMVCLVLLVRQLEQPWRGIIDIGVVAGLAWGLACLWWQCARAAFSANFNYDPEVPQAPQTATP